MRRIQFCIASLFIQRGLFLGVKNELNSSINSPQVNLISLNSSVNSLLPSVKNEEKNEKIINEIKHSSSTQKEISMKEEKEEEEIFNEIDEEILNEFYSNEMEENILPPLENRKRPIEEENFNESRKKIISSPPPLQPQQSLDQQILQLISSSGPISLKEITEKLSISNSIAVKIMEEFQLNGIIYEQNQKYSAM